MAMKPFKEAKNSPVVPGSALLQPITKVIVAKPLNGGARPRKPVKEKL